ncbi:MFS transporter [Echinimonas agarilytica]|uniref:MFS transporter n=1 Tax=Echinimonas agarilytica TaxID=1215918 RepID=A0AA41W4E5_9GAMM|nr:MFS transporter [Echinimonas agarilytica]MCM2678702.1 MFS transporter [Echinimonas agarilytica]
MTTGSEQLRFKEKVGYGLGDFASSMFWKMFSVYLLIFYTDVFGISAAAVGTMFLLTRIWDTANDPVMGVIADRTQSKYGKFRPFLLWGAIPFAVAGVLTFTTPDFTADGKLVYAYITYTLMMMAYTAVNVPYASLLGVMSSKSSDRTSLASYRMVFAFAGSIFAFVLVDPLTQFFTGISGEDNPQLGWMLTMVVYGCIASLLFYTTFSWTKERVSPPKTQTTSLRSDLKNLMGNKPWFILLGAALATLIFNSMRDGAAVFYFKYFVQAPDISLFGLSVGLITAYLVVGQAANIIGVLLAQPISERIGKRNTFMYAMFLAAVLSCLFFFLDASEVMLILLLQIGVSACAGIVFPLLWSMYADIADYSEYQTGRRSTGLIFSSSSFSQKMGWTLGGALTGWTLAYFGYEANAEQTELAKEGLRYMVSFLPAVGAGLSAIFMIFYKLSDGYMEKVDRELTSRRAQENKNG